MFKDQKEYLLLLHITSDLICLFIVYWLIIPFFLKIAGLFPSSFFSTIIFENNFCWHGWYLKLFPVFIFIPCLFMLVFRGYQKTGVQRKRTMLYQTGIICLACIPVLVFLFYFTLHLTFKESFALTSLPSFFLWIILILNRLHISFSIKKGCSNANIIRHILIVGTGENAISTAEHIKNHPEYGLRITGFLTDKDDDIGNSIANKKILGKVLELTRVIHDHYTDCVLFPGDGEYSGYYKFLVNTCSTVGLDFAAPELKLPSDTAASNYVSSESIGNLQLKLFKFVYRHPRLSFLKRVFDFIISCVLICLSIPFWIVIPIAIKLTSPGPVLFRQKRIGKYGKKFILYKFRSMIDNAEILQEKLISLNEMDGPAFKIKNDPRQTITGRFLRRTSLDELPQLWNVFKGDISMVGPRPAIEKEVRQYHTWERKRLSVIQGITCFWQVSGRNTIKFDEWMKLDLMYIDTWDIALDFKIFLKTIPAVLLKKGAY